MARALVAEHLYAWTVEPALEPPASGWLGTGTVTVGLSETSLRLQTTSNAFTYSRPLHSGDPPSRQRITEDAAVQVRIKLRSFATVWPGPTVGVLIRDGSRHLALVLGDRLAVVHPVDGTILSESDEQIAWSEWLVLRLEKRSDTAWTAYLNGRQLVEVPYLLAPAMGYSGSAEVLIGTFDPGGDADFEIDLMEAALNIALPHQWVVDKLVYGLPVAIQRVINPVHRAIVRTFAMISASVTPAADRLRERRSAAELPIEVFTADGTASPFSLRKPWTSDDDSTVSLVRQRIRIDGPGAPANIIATFDGVELPSDAEHLVRVNGLITRTWNVDPWDHVGPYLYISDGTRAVYALLMQLATDDYGWILSDSGSGGASVAIGAGAWRVDPRVSADVELRLLGQDYVLLIVDGQIVDRCPYTSAGSDTDHLARIGVATDAVTLMEFDRAIAATRCASTGQRAEFGRVLQAHLLPVGGCERNDELGVWLAHMANVKRYQPRVPGAPFEVASSVHAMRGTERGMLLELRRLCCDEDCFVVTETAPASWVLGASFPVVTPIFLHAAGDIVDIYVEFTWGPPGLTLDDVVSWLARYLVPLSTIAATFWISLITRITGASSSPAPGRRRYPVASVRHFEVGDEVHLRVDGTDVHESTIVVDVGISTIDVDAPVGTYTTGDILRLPIRATF